MLYLVAIFTLFYNPALSFVIWLWAIYFDRKARGL